MRTTLKSLISKPWDFEPKTIGEHVKRKRLELDLYQKDIAKQLGVTLFTVMNWEIGNSAPMTRHMPKLIDFLGYNPAPGQPKTIPELLKARRLELGLSQEQAAKKLGVDESTWARWERGRRMGDFEQRRRIASFIGAAEEEVHRANGKLGH